MAKKKSTITLKIIAATSVAIFSLLVSFSGAYAWFSMNKNINNSGSQLDVEVMEGRLHNIYVHSFNSVNSNETTYSFNKTPIATFTYDWATQSVEPDEDNPSTWNMGDFTSLDRTHPLLMVFAFDKDYTSTTVGDMYVKGKTTVGGNDLVTTTVNGNLETSGGGFLGARNAQGGPYYSLPQTQVKDENHPESILIKKTVQYDYYALSSVATFSNRTFSNSEYQTFSAGSYLSFATNSLEKDESFVSINNSTDKYVFNQNPYLFKSNGSGAIKYVALIIEYSQDAISYIYSTYLGDAGLNSYDSVLHFACDWTLEVA